MKQIDKIRRMSVEELARFLICSSIEEDTDYDWDEQQYAGNPVVSEITSVETLWGTVNFVVFIPEVVQFYSDQMFDLNGITTTIYQELAKEVFGVNDGIFFCTEKVEE